MHLAAEAVDARGRRASATSSTVRVWPGSKRTAVPAAMSSRMPRAASRSKRSAVVGLGEVVVRADLDRPVAGVGDLEGRRVARPALSSISPAAAMISPGIMRRSSADRLVHGDELGAVGERRLDLDLGDHLGDALHHLVAA